MPSDKKNTKASSGPGIVKSSLKQRTLLDSFTIRPSVKSVKPTSVELIVDCTEVILRSQDIPPSSSTDANFDESDSNSILEKQDLHAVHSSSDNPSSIELTDRRSPSVLLLDSVSYINQVLTEADCPEVSQVSRAEADGSTKDKPIIIDSSPTTLRAPLRSIVPISPSSVAGTNCTVPIHVAPYTSIGKKAALTGSPQIFDPGPFPLHVRGPQTEFSRPPLTISRSTSRSTATTTSNEICDYRFLKMTTSSQTKYTTSSNIRFAPIGEQNFVNSIPDEIKAAHPAISRLVDLDAGDKPISNRPWTEKWHPSCAQEVLGNESRAIYLRDWLCALELQLDDKNTLPFPTNSSKDGKETKSKPRSVTRGTKRPRVVRMVDKTRRKRSRLDSDEEDNWIVNTDDEEEVESDQFDEFGELIVNSVADGLNNPEALRSMPTQMNKRTSDLGQLYNTILLSGPSGCGKTASVYACAEELGWDVFEVYPGIGRRNASNVDNLIGEVGKNHLVLKTRDENPLKTFLKSKQKISNDEPRLSALCQISPRKTGSIDNSIAEYLNGAHTKSVRQSLILLEEVDILFKQDTNFWLTVTKIIEECKRPVICTCNDLSLVPVRDLPLQSILFFRPCPSMPAAYYLQTLCGAEGYHVEWTDILTLYSDPLGRMGLDEYGCPPTPDLRATINALQLSSCGPTSPRREPTEETGSKDFVSSATCLQPSIRQFDFFSVLDAHVEQDLSFKYIALAELRNHVPSEDDETGHVILTDTEDKFRLEQCDRQGEMIAIANELAREVFKVDTIKERQRIWAREEDRRRIRQEQRVIAGELCLIGVNEAPASMEYIPIARQILEAEDRLEDEMRPRSGRKTRNSERSEYVRMLEVTPGCRELINRVLAWV